MAQDTVIQFFTGIDYSLLKAQKLILIGLSGKKSLTNAERQTIEGMLCLLDGIQDIAVDCFDMDAEVVTLTAGREEGEELNMTIEEAKRIVLTQ